MKMAIKSMISGTSQSGAPTFELFYALFRFYSGISIALGAGFSKVFHKIDEAGSEEWSNLAFGAPEWFVEQVEGIGFTFISPGFWAYLAIYGEFIGGLLIAVGLFTRISALQMAFQFFVVSFIWYESPVPFTMYYQQLIFWSFALIAAVGGGQFSLDNWYKNKFLPKRSTAKLAPVLLLLLFTSVQSFGQAIGRHKLVSFTISNPGLKVVSVEIRHFDYASRKVSGYGYDLSALGSHAVTMPAGTRIYQKNRGKENLIFVITAADAGKKLNVCKPSEISREQWLQSARDEQNEASARLEKANGKPEIEALARAKNVEMIAFKIAGKGVWGRKTYIRVVLPEGFPNSPNNGFSKRLDRWTELQVRFPVGTKLYVCEGEFWSGKPFSEKLLVVVDAEKADYLFRI